MNSFVQGILDALFSTHVQPLIRSLKRRAAAAVREGSQGVRRVVILLCGLIFIITLVGAGLVLVPLSLLLFMPWAPLTKAIVGLVFGLAYLLLPPLAMLLLISEKNWMRITGIDQVLRDLED